MFKHIMIHRIKYYVRTKEFIFWLLLFPIILATLFNFAFSNLLEGEAMEQIPIAVVESQESSESEFYKEVFKNDSFKVQYVTEERANELLNNEEIDGFIYFNGGANLVIKENGTAQTILKEVLDYVSQQISAISNVYEANMGQVSEEFKQAMTNINSYIEEIGSSENTPNTVVAYFYTVLGMAAMYGAMIGVYEIVNIQANQSSVAMRINVAPVSKMKTFLSNLVVACMVEILIIMIIVLYIRFILQIDFGTRYPYIILTSVVGAVTGISFGTFLGAIIKKNENMKVGVVVAFTMACSYMAGMMGSDTKYVIKESAPIIDRLNPVNLITESYYKLYYYDSLLPFWENIAILTVMSIIFFAVTIWVLRRQQYDSI